ncbi:39S ribosomal protein L43, mitochondrial-like [Actinia tenebrosa]|uniref:Large ribosomal subunit protein mL43 n=1 Tax=Actinia tenebrosa TaxID=6105 RepID=A0A6P8HSW8_ACTTE|nr:39S ribosomal protein L43, mitochondrial-like [Actinia tenebrosa]
MAATIGLPNGMGRYVCQLQRVTLNYCRAGGSSRGLRDFIDQNVVSFAKSNPQVAVYVRERNGKHPRIVANYLNGNSKIIDIKNMEIEDIRKWLERLRGESGVKIEKIRKPWHTDNPSIQGTWTPFTNKPSLKM